ncbi:phospho-N-acetylmuramoyl-pentapeptide transferase [Chondrocystis sp. NIES-4102]|nr:phospho-N-acetylmuramoyl-pentapeptide transferase [Chondrocystis sp. NIES-4102]
MKARSISTAKPINPKGKTLAISLICTLIIGAIALEYTNYSYNRQWGLLLFPLLSCGIVSALAGQWIVPLLNRLKTGQIIQEDGPQTHLVKAGTPTMGGIFFVPVAVVISLILVGFKLVPLNISSLFIPVCLLTLGYCLIGWIDDWQVLRQKSNKGISPRMKLGLQILLGTIFTVWLMWHESILVTQVNLPGGIELSLGWLFLPLGVFVLAAQSNATNFTDGVDGLAAGTGAIAFLGLGAIISFTHPDLAVICACLSGGCLGFLVHNHNPARVFMGDTGSLAIGGALGAIGLSSGCLWELFIISGIFFIESLSVIAQITYYKATKDSEGKGKRLFKMAPIHHHLELSGWTETQVVGSFYLINILLLTIAWIYSSIG